MITTRNTYLNELHANKIDKDSDIYQKFISVYDLYQFGGDSDTSSLIDELLEHLFSSKLKNSNFCIPFTFINSPIGNVLFTTKFNNNSNNNSFTLAEVAILTNRSRALISMDLKASNLNASIFGKGTFFVTMPNLIEYMESKNFSTSVSKKRIHDFLTLKNQGLPLAEIKSKLNQE
ncbi:hypothetical protein [Clostridium saccharoperbutylacetonicum]|uniref:hypothetical protein n=1 Tax=Clostridium saccharoperbutylacetonicum TaxID=36745 RepID=UPI0039EA4611